MPFSREMKIKKWNIEGVDFIGKTKKKFKLQWLN